MKTRSRSIAAHRAEDAKLLQVDYYSRLRRDKRALSAFKSIRNRGATDQQVRALRDQIGMTAVCYVCDMWETRPSQQSRRKRLAELLFKTADEMEKNVESFGITLGKLCCELQQNDERASGGRKRNRAAGKAVVTGAPDWTLAAGLRQAAEMFLRPNGVDGWWQSRFERRVSFATYAFKSTFLLVTEVIGRRTRPMRITAKLVSALLNEDIDANVFQRDPLIEAFWPAKRHQKD
jgi:hypothetical protein